MAVATLSAILSCSSNSSVSFPKTHLMQRPPRGMAVGGSGLNVLLPPAAGSALATVVVTDPTAFCTASIAAADAPETVMVIARAPGHSV